MEGFLSGYKTYITVAIGVIAYGLQAMGIIPDVVFQAIAYVAAALGFAFLRAGVKKVNGK